MPENPEMEIEAKLAAYARKRREAARQMPELHPVNRRRLQEEVRQVYGTRPESRKGWWNLGFLPRLALGVGILVVLALLVHFSFNLGEDPETTLAKRTAVPVASEPMEDASAKADDGPQASSERRQRSQKSAAPSSAPIPESLERGTDTLSAPAAPGASTAAEPQQRSLRLMEDQTNKPLPLAAAKEAVVEDEAERELTLNAKLSFAPSLESGIQGLQAGRSWKFAVTEPGEEDRPASAAGLNHFEVHAMEQGLAIRARDGSTYKGGWITTEPDESLGRAASGGKEPAYRFRVAGTNLTSRQRVEFEGKLVYSPQKDAAEAGQASPPEAVTAAEWRIEGTVRVGETRQGQVQAVRRPE